MRSSKPKPGDRVRVTSLSTVDGHGGYIGQDLPGHSVEVVESAPTFEPGDIARGLIIDRWAVMRDRDGRWHQVGYHGRSASIDDAQIRRDMAGEQPSVELVGNIHDLIAATLDVKAPAEPREFVEGDPEPTDRPTLKDCDGDFWVPGRLGWTLHCGRVGSDNRGQPCSWEDALDYAPLVEVIG